MSWPGWGTTAWHEKAGQAPTTGYEHYWRGSLADGMRDASGQIYKRNRYYDPQTGQFTQPDPIGLAGGLNVYGFADGDPVSYDDPYGLCPPAPCDDSPENQPEALLAQGRALVTGFRRVMQFGAAVGEFLMPIQAIDGGDGNHRVRRIRAANWPCRPSRRWCRQCST